MDGLENAAVTARPGTILAFFGSFLWIVLLSPTLVESDAYRYAALLLILVAAYFFYRRMVAVKLHWMGWLCIIWSVYAAVRFLLIFVDTPIHQKGASEWLYIFPIFFPILGLALLLYRPYIDRIIAVFFGVALIFLLVTTDYHQIFAGDPVTPLIQKNRIHGAVACGLILISAFFWLMHSAMQGSRATRLSTFAMCAAPIVITLCLLNIYGSKSKGVWLAIVISLPLMFFLAQNYMKRHAARLLALAVLAILIGCIALFWQNIVATAGPTMTAIASGIDDFRAGADISNLFADSITSDQTPHSMNERLQLWSNAWEVIREAPVFGQGNNWLERWKATQYRSVGYTLMHNGYLEIAIRHGIFGLAVFFVLLVAFLRTVRRAQQRCLISLPALHCYYSTIAFFCITLLSNSNNRLAIGEAFFLVIGAVAFYCLMTLDRDESLGRPDPEPRAAVMAQD